MGVSNGRITAPINAQEPYVCLGVGQYNGWWDIGYICSNNHKKTNKWAKYKPMRYNTPADLTEEQRKSINYGLLVPAAQSQPAATKSDTWGYDAPQPGDFMRLNDFENYSHIALSPLADQEDLEFNIVFNSELTIALQKNPSPAGAYGITLTDITALKDYYLCLVLTLSDGSTVWKTSETTIDAGASSVKILKTELPQLGSGYIYGYYMCACSVKRSSLSGAAQTATYRSLPCDNVAGLAKSLTVKRELPILFTLTGISSQQSGQLPAQFGPVANYIGPLPGAGVSNKNNYYFLCGTYYTLQLKLTLDNTGQAITLDASKLSYSLSKTFATSNEAGPFQFTHVYEYDGTAYVEKTSLVFGGGESKTVVLEVGPDGLKYNGSGITLNPTAGQGIAVNLYYNYNGYTKLRLQDIRLRNSIIV